MKRLFSVLMALLLVTTCCTACVRKTDFNSPQEPEIKASQETIDLVNQIFSVDNYLDLCELTTMGYTKTVGNIERFASSRIGELEKKTDAGQALLLKYLETPVFTSAISEEENEETYELRTEFILPWALESFLSFDLYWDQLSETEQSLMIEEFERKEEVRKQYPEIYSGLLTFFNRTCSQ